MTPLIKKKTILVYMCITTILSFNDKSRMSLAQQNVSAASAMKFFKTSQASACDGESLMIQCNEDYIIDVITAERTILNETQANSASETTNSNNRLCQPGSISTPISITNKQQPFPQTNDNDAIPNKRDKRTSSLPSTNCDADQSREFRDNITSLVKSICWKTNSCHIDLRLTQNQSNSSLQNESSLPQTKQRQMSQNLSQLMNEPCPGARRKLLEIIYKCRPQTFKRSFYCRGSQLVLECPPEKRLLVPWAEYGYSPQDNAKVQDKCLPQLQQQTNDQLQQQLQTNQTVNITANNQTSVSSLRSNACVSPSAQRALMSECLLKQRCKLDINPSVLGEPNCGQLADSLPQYLRFNHFCANESLLLEPTLNENFVKNLLARQYSKAHSDQQIQQQQQHPHQIRQHPTALVLPPSPPQTAFKQPKSVIQSNNPDSPSLLLNYANSSGTTNNQGDLAEQEQSSDNYNNNNRARSSVNDDVISEFDTNQLIVRKQEQSGAGNSETFEVVPSPVSTNVVHNQRQNNWFSQERFKYLLSQYGHRITLFSTCLTSITVIALLVRACHLESSRRSKATNAKSASSCSTSSSTSSNSTSSSGSNNSTGSCSKSTNKRKGSVGAPPKSFASSIQLPLKHSASGSVSPPLSINYSNSNNNKDNTSNKNNNYHIHSGVRHQTTPRLNSTSESYFSLAEFANNNNTNYDNSLSSTNVHEAYPQSYRPIDSSNISHNSQPSDNSIAPALARPRLWTIHPNNNQRYNTTSASHLRTSHNYQHARSFFPVAPPLNSFNQVTSIHHGHHAKNNFNLQQPAPNTITQYTPHQQTVLPPNAHHHDNSNQNYYQQQQHQSLNSPAQLVVGSDETLAMHDHHQQEQITPDSVISQELEKAAEYIFALTSGPNLVDSNLSRSNSSQQISLAPPPPEYDESNYWHQHQHQQQNQQLTLGASIVGTHYDDSSQKGAQIH